MQQSKTKLQQENFSSSAKPQQKLSVLGGELSIYALRSGKPLTTVVNE